MLVLSRRIGESIIIGDDVKVTIVQIERGKVRLGIQAKPEIPVHREEIWIELHKGEVDGKNQQAGIPPGPRERQPRVG